MEVPRRRRDVPRMLAAAAVAFLLAAPQVLAQTLERIAETGTIKIGYREDARPFSYRDKSDVPIGYSIELCRSIAAAVKTELKLANLSIDYIPVTTQNRFQSVADGWVDILCGASTVTLARRELVSFSIPTYMTGISPVMRADAPAFLRDALAARASTAPPRTTLLQAFADRTFGARAGTTAGTWLRNNIKTLSSNAELLTVGSHDEGLRQVADGKLDAYFADRAILLGLTAADADPGQFVVGERLYTHEPYGLALSKRDDDFRLLVDRSLSRLYRSPEIVPILTRYFGPPEASVLSRFLMTALPE